MANAGVKLIYVVEDDEAVRNSVRALLEALGYSARLFVSAEDFMEQTGGKDGHCLVLDHHLPGMSGIELLEKLRAQGIDTPAIIVTGNGPILPDRAGRAGAIAVLRKPLAAEPLAEWLEKICPLKP